MGPVSVTRDAPAVTRPQSAVIRPALRVELSERLYQGVFGVGLITAGAFATCAVAVALLQPAGSALRSCAATLAALMFIVLLYRRRHHLYWRTRRHPAVLVAVASALAACAAAAGPHNEQMFYVVSATIAVVGVAAPLRTVTIAAAVGGTGIAAPYVVSGGGPYGVAAAAIVLPVLFSLVAARLAEFLLIEDLEPVRIEDAMAHTDVVDAPAPPAHSRRTAAPAEKPAASPPSPPLRHDATLTPRQLQALLLVREGLRHAEIADCLGITTKRVRDLLSDARERVGATTTAHLVAWLVASERAE